MVPWSQPELLYYKLFRKNLQQLPTIWLWGTRAIWPLSYSINSAGELRRTSPFTLGSQFAFVCCVSAAMVPR